MTTPSRQFTPRPANKPRRTVTPRTEPDRTDGIVRPFIPLPSRLSRPPPRVHLARGATPWNPRAGALRGITEPETRARPHTARGATPWNPRAGALHQQSGQCAATTRSD